jgi:enamine deaminase RidA (YjgF/YER057c/UK114 family)
MRAIISDRMPPVKGHYSPVIEHNGTKYLSGQIPIISLHVVWFRQGDSIMAA